MAVARTIKLEIDGKEYVGIPREEYDRLKAGLLPRPAADSRDRYPVQVLGIDLANQLTLWRRAADMTQKELADAAGVAQETISRFERAEKFPKQSTVKKLEAVLEAKVPWSDVLDRKQKRQGKKRADI